MNILHWPTFLGHSAMLIDYYMISLIHIQIHTPSVHSWMESFAIERIPRANITSTLYFHQVSAVYCIYLPAWIALPSRRTIRWSGYASTYFYYSSKLLIQFVYFRFPRFNSLPRITAWGTVYSHTSFTQLVFEIAVDLEPYINLSLYSKSSHYCHKPKGLCPIWPR